MLLEASNQLELPTPGIWKDKSVVGKTKTSCLPALKVYMWLCMVKPLKRTSSKDLLLLRAEPAKQWARKNTLLQIAQVPQDQDPLVAPYQESCQASDRLRVISVLSSKRKGLFHRPGTAFSCYETVKDKKKEATTWPQVLLSTTLKVLGKAVEGVLLHGGEGVSVGETSTTCCATGTYFLSLLKKTLTWGPWNRTSKPQISHKHDAP